MTKNGARTREQPRRPDIFMQALGTDRLDGARISLAYFDGGGNVDAIDEGVLCYWGPDGTFERVIYRDGCQTEVAIGRYDASGVSFDTYDPARRLPVHRLDGMADRLFVALMQGAQQQASATGEQEARE